MKRYALLIPLLVLSSVLALPQPCAACSCVEPTPAGSIANATAVFRGRVTAITPQPGSRFQTVSLLADTGWKGMVTRDMTLVTDKTSASCGFPFQVGMEYLVFARQEPSGSLTTGLCSGTQPLAGPQTGQTPISAFLAALGPDTPVTGATPPAMPAAGLGGATGLGLEWLVVIAAAALIGGGICLGCLRRRKVAR